LSSVLKIFKEILFKKDEHYISVEWEFYRRWSFVLNILVGLNKNYRKCLIFRKKIKLTKRIVVIGLKKYDKKVKRRTSGFAKDFLNENKNVRCLYCNTKLTQTNANTDHIIPISKGGNNTQVNLVVCCLKCNSDRGDADFYTYLRSRNEKLRKVRHPFI